ncbi:mycofactocin radical SAM maturase [Nocardia donostiensis]|uniref:Mycofactocin maturase MftC n=1 Tax=Nocardia donostiensis TaxID=1538463 RepID=A0A1W0BCN7_9NOCA|nr:mycofactocin radical SAM maturase [Nocardia donostiensis]ONM47096.1 radical SAM protein [Nocardia donostiensis]OQS20081.1 radical SAM protein [Nocardia donostiensis]
MLDLDTRWQLHPRVALRPEPFGALLYHFGTRKLSFLKNPRIVEIVRSLPGHVSARSALRAAGVRDENADPYVKALAQLVDSDMIVGAPPDTELSAPAPFAPAAPADPAVRLVDRFESGLAAPICLTWELTYACNLSCVHCLSSSGRRDPRELSTEQCKALIDEFQRMQVFYVNIGGGEPTVRPDFWELVDYATAHQVGVKFSTNGVRITPEVAQRLAASDYVDVQISLDGADAEVNDAVRGPGSYDTAIRALENLANAGFSDAKLSVVATRHNIAQLDQFREIAERYGATLRLTRLRPSGRGADVWDELHPLPEQQRELYEWLLRNGEGVLTGDSFFHLSAYGAALPGLNMCGAGRVVCLVDPVGDVYACPFAIHERFHAGNVVTDGGFATVWRESELFTELREPSGGGACSSCAHYDSCRGGCMAAKFFTGLPVDGPDPECVQGYGEAALADTGRVIPRPAVDHSRRSSRKPGSRKSGPVPLTLLPPVRRPSRACDESPLA